MHPIDIANEHRNCNQERLLVPAPPCGTLCPAVHSMWCSQMFPTLKNIQSIAKRLKRAQVLLKNSKLVIFVELAMLYFLLVLLPSLPSR